MDRIELIKLWRFKSLCKINSAVLSHCKCSGEYIYGHDKYNIDGKHLQEKNGNEMHINPRYGKRILG